MSQPPASPQAVPAPTIPATLVGSNSTTPAYDQIFDLTPASDIRSRTTSKQDAVKWLAGALFGAGVAVGIGGQASKLGDGGAYFAWRLICLSVAFGVVAFALWTAFRVLTVRRLPIEQDLFKSDKSGIDGSERLLLSHLPLDALPALARATTSTLAIVELRRAAAPRPVNRDDLRFASAASENLRRLQDQPQNPGERALLAYTSDQITRAIDQADAWLDERSVASRLRLASKAMVSAAVLAILALVGLLWLDSRAHDVASNNAELKISTPFAATVQFSPADIDRIRQVYESEGGKPDACTLPVTGQQVDATVVGGTDSRPLVSFATDGCPIHHVTIPGSEVFPATEPQVQAEVEGQVILGEKDVEQVAQARGLSSDPRDGECVPIPGVPVKASLVAGTIENPLRLRVHQIHSGVSNCKAVTIDVTDKSDTSFDNVTN